MSDTQRKSASKFKPAVAGPSGASSTAAAVRKRIQSDAPFASSTPSLNKRTMSPPRHVLEIPDSPPIKRISSASSDRAQGPASKRFKPSIPSAIDRSPQKSPCVKPSSSLVRFHQDRGEVSSEVDFLNPGFNPTKHPVDPFKSSRKFIPSLPSRPPPSPPGDFSDLSAKSLDELQFLITSNRKLRASIGQLMFKHLQETESHDVVALSLCISQTDARIRAINQRIESIQGRCPSPLPATFSLGTPTCDTTLDHAFGLIQDTLMTIDLPGTSQKNSQKSDKSTTLVNDNDDGYYDKFDPIPDDLILLDTDKADAPRSSNTTSSMPAPTSSASVTPTVFSGRIDHTSSPYYKEVISTLKNIFKLSSFRTNQLECIVATLDAKDVFYLAPTGGGKSLCFQLPALCITGKTQGTTFVISPLISLITDQVASLRKKGVPAFPLTSAAEENEVRQVMSMMRSNAGEKPKLVYTTPERLQKSDSLKDVVSQLYEEKQLARFVIDEAHVIGSWGRDFRASVGVEWDPDLGTKYAGLNVLRKNWPDVPIMALTGSANKDAIEDIKHSLTMRDPVCLAQSFNRPNLHYSVRKKPSLKKDLAHSVATFIKSQHPNDTGIIYVLSRADTEEMAQKLRDENIEARHYHAGVNNEERKLNQNDWMSGRCKVIVATIAFGMGIDKPDVRFVIHATLSKDMDGYYQETGRAGRDQKASDCVLFYAYSDAVKIEQMLRNPNDSTRDKPSNSEIERQVSKLQAVVAYCSNESDCRRALILRHFDEEFKPDDCHNQCDNCHRPGVLVRRDFTAEATSIIQLLNDMIAVNTRVTLGQLKDTWKGKNNKAVKPYKGLSLYASGKALGHPTVERLFNQLITDGAIAMYRVPCSSGFSNTYIQLGGTAADYLNGNKRLELSWKEREGDANMSAKRGPGRPPRGKGKEPDFRPAASYRSLYEDIEDADDDSRSELFKDAIDDPAVLEPAPSKFPRTSTSRTPGAIDCAVAPRGPPAMTSEDQITVRLRRLQEKRLSLSERWTKRPEEILHDDTLEIIALAPPEDEHAFKQILQDNEDESDVENKWHSFAYEFLDVVKGQ